MRKTVKPVGAIPQRGALRLRWPDKINFPLALTLIFLLLGYIGIVHHEMWRDELEAWMIARDNNSLAGVAAAIKYEGHPILWYLGLYAITRFTHDPFAMQVYHVLIASAVIWVFAAFSPFTKLQKTLFAFGFYPFYEYAIKSRGYALGILLIFLFCLFYKDRSKRYILLSCILFLLCQTSAMGFIVAVSLQATLIFELISDGDFRRSVNKKAVAAMLAIFSSGVAVSLLQILPPGDSHNAVTWCLHFDELLMERVLGFISRAYLCSPYYWYFDPASGAYQAEMLFTNIYLSAAFFLFLSLVFLRKPKVLFLYVFSAASFLAFFYFKYSGFSWHHGHLYILLITCFWLSAFYPDTLIRKRLAAIFLTIILAVHLYQGVRVYVKDYFCQFSAAKDAAQFIKDNGLEDMPIAADPDDVVAPVAGYLDREIYYLRQGRSGTYVKWDAARQKEYDGRKLRSEPLLEGRKSILIVNGELENLPDDIRKIKEFPNAMVQDERYRLYLLDFEKPK
jgi:hypothetical protein